MRVILSGGGTGGHVYPAISIANKIKEKHPNAEILFIGTRKGIESDIVPGEGYPIKFITVNYLKRKISLHNIKSVVMLLKGMFEASRIIKDFRPDIVIGTGGFVCGPVVYVASKHGIKTIIHEQNVFPGLTNRILDKYVDRIALSFEEAKQFFKSKDKLVVTGNPIRSDFFKVTEQEAVMRYGGKSDKPLVLVVGGSGGAFKINNAVVEMLKKYRPKEFRVILATGERLYDRTVKSIRKPDLAENHEIVPYINDMPYALRACDLIVCSAGAITIAEITAVGKPAILIPKAHTAEDHQQHNADAMRNEGAAFVIYEDELNSKILNENIMKILGDKETLEHMGMAGKKRAIVDATDRIYNEIKKLLTI